MCEREREREREREIERERERERDIEKVRGRRTTSRERAWHRQIINRKRQSEKKLET